MHRLILGISVAVVLLLTVPEAAYAPYHTQYPPPPTPPPAPSPAQPQRSGLSAVRAQAKVAASHAGFASQGGSISYAKGHLRHVLVCIEGPKGRNVKSTWENPCKGMGNGVLVDLQRIKASPSLLQKGRTADATAVAALKSTNLARIKADAKQVSVLMTQIAQAK